MTLWKVMSLFPNTAAQPKGELYKLILIINTFYMWEFAYSLKFINNPKIYICGTFTGHLWTYIGQ